MVHAHATKDEAKAALVAGWDAVRQAEPERSQVMLAYTRADVRDLNELARAKVRASGALGTLERLEGSSLTVHLDDRRAVRFDLKDYAHVDYGYAATIHKAQGVTVDRA